MTKTLNGKVSVIKEWCCEKGVVSILFYLQGICIAQGELADRISRIPRGCKVSVELEEIKYLFSIYIGCGKNIEPKYKVISVKVE